LIFLTAIMRILKAKKESMALETCHLPLLIPVEWLLRIVTKLLE
jgi:hypothetical protein